MKEKLLPAALTGAVILGANSLNVESAGESCEEANARQDAEIAATYRTAVDADRTAAIIFLALTQQQGRPYTLEEYKLLFDYMVEDIQDGKDPMVEGFRNDAGIEKTIYEGGEEEDGNS